MKAKTILISVTLGIFFAFSCGSKKGDSAQIRLAVGNETEASLFLQDPSQIETSQVAPSYYGVRVVGVSLRYVADPTNPSSPPQYESGIYIAKSGCSNGGKSETEKDDKTYEYYQPPGPQTCTIENMDVIDFARDTEEVNEELAAGRYPVIPGTYNQATICYMSLYDIAFEGHFDDPIEYDVADENNSSSGCIDTILENFTVAEGESATVRLDYDLTQAAVKTTGSNNTEEDTGCLHSDVEDGTYFCVNGLTATPVGIKE